MPPPAGHSREQCGQRQGWDVLKHPQAERFSLVTRLLGQGSVAPRQAAVFWTVGRRCFPNQS